jgi:hypothetical protein
MVQYFQTILLMEGFENRKQLNPYVLVLPDGYASLVVLKFLSITAVHKKKVRA